MDDLGKAALLATVVNRLVAGLVTPIFDEYNLDRFWLTYVAWGIGAALVFSTGINFFPGLFLYPLIGQVLSAVIAGGGANLIHDLLGAWGARPTSDWDDDEQEEEQSSTATATPYTYPVATNTSRTVP